MKQYTSIPLVPTVLLTPVANLPPVSTTPAVLVTKFAAVVVDTYGKFATGVVDTGGKLPLVLLIPVVHLSNFSKKFVMTLMFFSGLVGR